MLRLVDLGHCRSTVNINRFREKPQVDVCDVLTNRPQLLLLDFVPSEFVRWKLPCRLADKQLQQRPSTVSPTHFLLHDC